MEQVALQESISVIKELGPYGFTMVVLLYLFLDAKGWLPRKLSLRNGNGTTHTILTNHIPHIERDINEIKIAIKDKVSYDWAEREIDSMKNELKHDIEKVETRLDDRISRVDKRVDKIGGN